MDQAGAFIRASVTIGKADNDPFPFPTRLRVEHRLTGRMLFILAEATNIGASPMPMGFGLHPWFTVPLRPSGLRAACKLSVPASACWELDENIPTGRIQPAVGSLDLHGWRPIDDQEYDHVYTKLRMDRGWFTAALRNPDSRRTITIRSDTSFREHVVYPPTERDVVCLEPYTCTTDAFNLEARGVVAGTIVLEPGATWSGRVVIAATTD